MQVGSRKKCRARLIAPIAALLVFAGLQMQQSQDVGIAGQYHARAALPVENLNSEGVAE
jgi:hypothetical protein